MNHQLLAELIGCVPNEKGVCIYCKKPFTKTPFVYSVVPGLSFLDSLQHCKSRPLSNEIPEHILKHLNRAPTAPQPEKMLWGDMTEWLLGEMGITQERYCEAKKRFGLAPNCWCPARIKWMNAVHRWAIQEEMKRRSKLKCLLHYLKDKCLSLKTK